MLIDAGEGRRWHRKKSNFQDTAEYMRKKYLELFITFQVNIWKSIFEFSQTQINQEAQLSNASLAVSINELHKHHL